MKKFKLNLFLSILFLTFISIGIKAQATLKIVNDSERQMTVKIMKSNYYDASLFKTVRISAFSEETVRFYTSGYFFNKTKAEKRGRDPIFTKDDEYKVYYGTDGYSVMTLTYSIYESEEQSSSGTSISEAEFNRD